MVRFTGPRGGVRYILLPFAIACFRTSHCTLHVCIFHSVRFCLLILRSWLCVSGSTVAVKRLLNQKVSAEMVKDFKRECFILRFVSHFSLSLARMRFFSHCWFCSSLRHPNVVLYMGACVQASNYCIVTEYCVKGSVATLLQSSPHSLNWKLR